jgi:hypothetical protein
MAISSCEVGGSRGEWFSDCKLKRGLISGLSEYGPDDHHDIYRETTEYGPCLAPKELGREEIETAI